MAQFQNFYASRLYAAIGSGDTTITVETAPLITAGYAVIEARNATKREIVKFTGVSGTNLTGVTRGLGETDATDHVKGALIEINVVAENLEELYDAFESYVATTSDWRDLVTSVTSVTYNGNRSYDVLLSSDQSSLLSPGMRLHTTRGTTAPTQSALLNGTNQYFVKTSPAGMTFTDDFAVSAWINLSSYPATNAEIVSRFNGTSGWSLRINSAGQVTLVGWNAGAGNYKYVASRQSIPLNKRTHVALQLDMSTAGVSTTTSYAMIDGVNVSVEKVAGGTSPNSLIQAGNLEVGSYNGGANNFPGKISQAAIFSTKIDQATMRNYISQGLTGTEPGVISVFPLNGTPNDLAATGNNLTAMNAAGYTTDSPFTVQASGTPNGSTDYGIIQKVNGATVTVQAAEGCAFDTRNTISAIKYSTMKAPYGFPSDRNRWTIISTHALYGAKNAPAANTYYNPIDWSLYVPVGRWKCYYAAPTQTERSAAGVADVALLVATSSAGDAGSASLTGEVFGSRSTYYHSGGAQLDMAWLSKSFELSVSAATHYYVNSASSASGLVAAGVRLWLNAFPTFEAENAYL